MASNFLKQLSTRLGNRVIKVEYVPDRRVGIYDGDTLLCTADDIAGLAGQLLVWHNYDYDRMIDTIAGIITSQLDALKLELDSE